MSSQPILSYRRESRANRAPNRRTENYRTKPFLAATIGNQATYASRASARPMPEAKAMGLPPAGFSAGGTEIPKKPIVSRNQNKSSDLCLSVEPAMARGEAIGIPVPGSNWQPPQR